ncbi:MAG TPA: OmpH family outer membrane protein [Candidatus Sulfotelmatobacter sp.]|jgi:outer membrane protein|nr:OmpH family outer membrane protein [Candidatus Sulfotelmatobacter sp.]
MKRLVVSVLILVAAASGSALAQTPAGGLKIGVFDANRVSEETEEGKRIAARLSAFGDKKKAELAAKEKEIGDLRKQLDEGGGSFSPEKQSQMQKDIQKKSLELQQAQEGARNEFQIEVSEAQNKFQEQLLRVINQFGRDEGFTLVLERNTAGVAFAAESVDVTTAIVDKFNELVKPQPDAKSDAKPADKPADKPAAKPADKTPAKSPVPTPPGGKP